MSNSVDSFLERVQMMSPTKLNKTFEKKRTIEKIHTGARPNQGKYQLLPINSTVSDFPYVVLQNTREIKMPRRNVLADGTEQTYEAWIKLLPKNAYTIKDPSTGREVSSLTAADEKLLDQAYQVWEELYKEVDGRNNAMNPTIGGAIRRKNYTVFYSYVVSQYLNGNTRTPDRQNFSALMVVTSKGFMDLVANSIADTNITAGLSNPSWDRDIYNRDASGRKGFLMFSISKADGPGFNISINHQLGMEQYLAGVKIPEEDLELMQNPVEGFLGWQANRDEDSPVDQKRLFNKKLITETIEFMTEMLTKVRLAKQSGTSIEEAISVTNKTLLNEQEPTNTNGIATNDPILAEMAREAGKKAEGGYGNNNFVGSNAEEIAAKNTNPFQTPPVARFDPLTGTPVGEDKKPEPAPFQQPAFANNGFGGGTDGMPF